MEEAANGTLCENWSHTVIFVIKAGQVVDTLQTTKMFSKKFDWGNKGAESKQTALAILAHYFREYITTKNIKDSETGRNFEKFLELFVAIMPKAGFAISRKQIENFLTSEQIPMGCRLRYLETECESQMTNIRIISSVKGGTQIRDLIYVY
jgi:hypothetical protein